MQSLSKENFVLTRISNTLRKISLVNNAILKDAYRPRENRNRRLSTEFFT